MSKTCFGGFVPGVLLLQLALVVLCTRCQNRVTPNFFPGPSPAPPQAGHAQAGHAPAGHAQAGHAPAHTWRRERAERSCSTCACCSKTASRCSCTRLRGATVGGGRTRGRHRGGRGQTGRGGSAGAWLWGSVGVVRTRGAGFKEAWPERVELGGGAHSGGRGVVKARGRGWRAGRCGGGGV